MWTTTGSPTCLSPTGARIACTVTNRAKRSNACPSPTVAATARAAPSSTPTMTATSIYLSPTTSNSISSKRRSRARTRTASTATSPSPAVPAACHSPATSSCATMAVAALRTFPMPAESPHQAETTRSGPSAETSTETAGQTSMSPVTALRPSSTSIRETARSPTRLSCAARPLTRTEKPSLAWVWPRAMLMAMVTTISFARTSQTSARPCTPIAARATSTTRRFTTVWASIPVS